MRCGSAPETTVFAGISSPLARATPVTCPCFTRICATSAAGTNFGACFLRRCGHRGSKRAHAAPRIRRVPHRIRVRCCAQQAATRWNRQTTVPGRRQKSRVPRLRRAASPSRKIQRQNPRPPSGPSESGASFLSCRGREPCVRFSAASRDLPSTGFSITGGVSSSNCAAIPATRARLS